MKVTTTGVACFVPPAVLGLSKEQAACRAYALEKAKGGYAVIKPVQFKAGETLEVGDIPKGMESVLQAVDEAKPKQAAAAPTENAA